MLKNLLFNINKRCLRKFIWNMGIKGMRTISQFEKRQKRGKDFFPAFHFISVTDDCNLQCQGCWVVGKKKHHQLSPADIDSIIEQSKAKGSYFFGILGGEPLLYNGLMEIFEKHQDCYFQLFTNGTMLNETVALRLQKLANVTPLISFEGDEQVADIRRGGRNVYQKTWSAIDQVCNAGLISGVAMSVCKSNFDLAFSDTFIKSLQKKGVTYLWYYIYRPVGPDAKPELALSIDEINALRKFMVKARSKYKIIIIDAYWDAYGKGLCPAASGLSHHINAAGDIEPCPIFQFSTNNIKDGKLSDIYKNSNYLSNFRNQIPELTEGCVLMDHPEWVVNFVDAHQAQDTSGRGNERERLSKMPKVDSHGSAEKIPEQQLPYRIGKKKAFFGLGAYG